MKVYLVYKITRDKTGEVMLHPFLYGYTTKKSIIKEFENQRDMKHFAIIDREFSKDEYHIFDRDNRYQYITLRKYITYRKDDLGYIKDYIEIASTEYEEEQTYVWTDVALLEAGKYTKYPEYIFNKDIIKALKYLEYNTIGGYHNSGGIDIMYPPVKVGKKTLPNIDVDMFYVFMFLFGNTMNK